MDLINQPVTDKGKKTVKDLENAARKLFYEKGYHKTTIKDIAKLANSSVGAFYLYFEDKLSLYKYIVQQYGAEIRQRVYERTKGITSQKEAERQGMFAFIELVREHPDMYNVLWESIYIDPEIFKNYYLDFAKRYSRSLKQAEQNGEVKIVNIDALAFMLIGIHTFLGVGYGVIKNEEDLESVADQLLDMLNNGIFI